ncbi:hypothetical protein CCACVL1_23708 [Corchorus capsularis]|uniref:Uncharacterized protein n=1 Tax=Corchorus capsularis TaxID=210143 RepID=A0A1R3GSZ5_COCAP|nr:hypothetical protein CCACVL1_23708 [Corchorus capsularis]
MVPRKCKAAAYLNPQPPLSKDFEKRGSPHSLFEKEDILKRN